MDGRDPSSVRFGKYPSLPSWMMENSIEFWLGRDFISSGSGSITSSGLPVNSAVSVCCDDSSPVVRVTSILILDSGNVSSNALWKDSISIIEASPSFVIMSPTCMPASAAGVPGATAWTLTPSSDSIGARYPRYPYLCSSTPKRNAPSSFLSVSSTRSMDPPRLVR